MGRHAGAFCTMCTRIYAIVRTDFCGNLCNLLKKYMFSIDGHMPGLGSQILSGIGPTEWRLPSKSSKALLRICLLRSQRPFKSSGLLEFFQLLQLDRKKCPQAINLLSWKAMHLWSYRDTRMDRSNLCSKVYAVLQLRIRIYVQIPNLSTWPAILSNTISAA